MKRTKCSICGEINGEKRLFCIQCGSRINEHKKCIEENENSVGKIKEMRVEILNILMDKKVPDEYILEINDVLDKYVCDAIKAYDEEMKKVVNVMNAINRKREMAYKGGKS